MKESETKWMTVTLKKIQQYYNGITTKRERAKVQSPPSGRQIAKKVSHNKQKCPIRGLEPQPQHTYHTASSQ